MKVTEEIRNAIPEELRKRATVYWSEKSQRFYVYRVIKTTYDPKKKRGVDQREALGSIVNGVFVFSPSFLKNQEIDQLKEKIAKRKTKADPQSKRPSTCIRAAAGSVKDVRQKSKVRYELGVVLFVATLASFAGYTSAVSIANYWRQHHSVLADLIEGFPQEDISHDTVNRILRLIVPKDFTELLHRLTAGYLKEAVRTIHIDGQAVRASKTDKCKQGRYIFNAYDSGSKILITHLLIDEKENEISNSERLIQALDLGSGDILTADALNTQRNLVGIVVGKKAGYCLAVKENQVRLYKEILYLTNTAKDHGVQVEDLDSDHGRIETRKTLAISGKYVSKALLDMWPGLKDGSIVANTTIRENKKHPEESTSFTRYFMTTLPSRTKAEVKTIADVIRSHWSVENDLHWVLDVDYNQDRIQSTNGNYLTNRSLLNKLSVAVLRQGQMAYKKKHGLKMSIRSLLGMCSTPADALELFGMTLGEDFLNDCQENTLS